ncbi:N-acetyl-gamma-glutamyl-phosphate reductase [Clostridia bacterium]|nr:N-acetyl-gamma-glutamyl-phosphate reductase [Clostridia bacterium]
MKPKIFIDGAEGTTGLRIHDRLSARGDIELLAIEPALRKDAAERERISKLADVVFLCLPDAAAREAAGRVGSARVIDASTAHRTSEGWAYGFPELSPEHRSAIAGSRYTAVPGCHATGFISAVYPLRRAGILPADYPLTCHSLTGYSGGGKAMIREYESESRPGSYDTPRLYALEQKHKHLPEMRAVCGLEFPPVFNPIVCDFYSGMSVAVPLHTRLFAKKVTALNIWEILSEHYAGERLVTVLPFGGEGALSDGTAEAGAMAGTDRLELLVAGNDDRAVVVTRLDNLGKGSSGAAVQCMNICCGFDETEGLAMG